MRQNILPQAIASIHRYDGGPENVPPTHLRVDVIEQYQPEPRENIPVVSCVSRDRFGNINNIKNYDSNGKEYAYSYDDWKRWEYSNKIKYFLNGKGQLLVAYQYDHNGKMVAEYVFSMNPPVYPPKPSQRIITEIAQRW